MVLSSHQLREVDNLCNRIAIFEKGRVILQGELSALKRQYRYCRILTDRPAEAAAFLKDRFQLQSAEVDAFGILVALDGRTPEAINAALVNSGFAVSALAPDEGWLDRLFLRFTTSRESMSGGAGATERPAEKQA